MADYFFNFFKANTFVKLHFGFNHPTDWWPLCTSRTINQMMTMKKHQHDNINHIIVISLTTRLLLNLKKKKMEIEVWPSKRSTLTVFTAMWSTGLPHLGARCCFNLFLCVIVLVRLHFFPRYLSNARCTCSMFSQSFLTSQQDFQL